MVSIGVIEDLEHVVEDWIYSNSVSTVDSELLIFRRFTDSLSRLDELDVLVVDNQIHFHEDGAKKTEYMSDYIYHIRSKFKGKLVLNTATKVHSDIKTLFDEDLSTYNKMAPSIEVLLDLVELS